MKKIYYQREEILKPLRVVRESLEQNQSENIASGDLLDLLRRAKCFGINLARLDIRQESSRHSQLLGEYIRKKLNQDYSHGMRIENKVFVKKMQTKMC